MKGLLLRLLAFVVATGVTFIVYSGLTIPERGVYSLVLAVWINQMIDVLERMET